MELPLSERPTRLHTHRVTDVGGPPVLDQLVAVERAEGIAGEAAAYADEMAETADEAVEAFESCFNQYSALAEATESAELLAKQASDAAAVAAAEARMLERRAKAARKDGLVSATGGDGVGSALFDINIAVHCVRPTGKSQCKSHKLHMAIARARKRVDETIEALATTSAKLAVAQSEVTRLSEAEEHDRRESDSASAELELLLEKQSARDWTDCTPHWRHAICFHLASFLCLRLCLRLCLHLCLRLCLRLCRNNLPLTQTLADRYRNLLPRRRRGDGSAHFSNPSHARVNARSLAWCPTTDSQGETRRCI